MKQGISIIEKDEQTPKTSGQNLLSWSGLLPGMSRDPL